VIGKKHMPFAGSEGNCYDILFTQNLNLTRVSHASTEFLPKT